MSAPGVKLTGGMPCVFVAPVNATARKPKLPRMTAITAVSAQRRPASGAPEAKIGRDARARRLEAATPLRAPTFRHRTAIATSSRTAQLRARARAGRVAKPGGRK